jgi:16S rRNA (guanine527-N7)-methyltransferase
VSFLAGSFEETIAAALAVWGIPVTSDQHTLFRKHFEAVLLANQSMNLTRITEPKEAAIKHYVDSLAILLWERGVSLLPSYGPPGKAGRLNLLDVGTGAGFPAVPIAVMRPDWRVTALDGTRKKAEFVGRTGTELGLKNLVTEHGHSDHWTTVGTFDVVTTRAVAPLGKCIRTCGRFLKKSGRLIAYKTANLAGEELSEAQEACAELGMEMEPPILYELELNTEKMSRALYPVRRVT